MKNNMKSTDYYKSGKHKENVLNAQCKAIEATIANKQKRVELYNNNPTLCKCCNISLLYNKRHNKFCSKSCSATINNTGRVRTQESKLKTSRAIKTITVNQTVEEKQQKAELRTKQYKERFPDVEYICPICNQPSVRPYIQRNRKTCGSDDCKVQASVGIRNYQNGSRKPVWFYNPYENKDVLLESSWEVKTAKLLISKNIKWVRPPFIKWTDSAEKERRYFPDFYLPEYNVYLDPKNPYCLKLDKEKILEVRKQVTLIVGGLDIIENYINSLQ